MIKSCKELREDFHKKIENFKDDTAFNEWQIRKTTIHKIIDEVFDVKGKMIKFRKKNLVTEDVLINIWDNEWDARWGNE